MNKTSSKKQSLLSRLMNPKYIMVYATVAIFLIIYLFGAINYGDKGFLSLRTLIISMFTENAYYGISAVGMTMVLITGGIDLSVGAVSALTGMIIAYGVAIMNRPADGRRNSLPECTAVHHDPDRHVPDKRNLFPDEPGIHRDQ